MYRFDATRQGNAEKMLVQPPYKPLWFFRAGSLVEFPPAVAYGRLYFANAKGVLFAVETKRVRTVWAYRAHRCTAASPAVDNHTVYMTFLNKPPCNATRSGLDGEVVALNADTGKVRWRLKIGPTESSPLVLDGVVYVGDWNGRVYALSAASGATRWTFQTGDKIKDARRLLGRPRLLRLLRPPRLRPERAHRQARLEGDGPAAARQPRHLLLDARRRLRPRLHRLDRRQGLLVRRHEREAALVARHRRLRLLLAGRLPAARVRRLVHRRPLLLRRGDRRRALEVPDERADLGLADRDQRRRLRLVAEGPHLRPRPAHRQAALVVPARRLRGRRLRPQAALPRRLRTDLRPRAAACAGRLSRRCRPTHPISTPSRTSTCTATGTRSPATGGSPLGGLAAGIIVGYLISLGGAQVYKAKAVVYLGQPLSQGGVQVQSQATNPSTVKEIVTAESTIRAVARDAGLRPGQLRGHISTQAVSGNISRLGQNPLVAITRHRPRPPAGGARRERPGADGRLLERARRLLEDEDRQPAAAGRPGEGDAEHAEHQPEGAAGRARQRLRPLDERAADRARPAQRPAAAAADDHRPADDQPAAARARQGRRGAADHDPRRGDEDDRAQPPQHGAGRGADRPDPRHRRRAALRARRRGPSAAARSVQPCSTESGCRSSSPRTTRRS